MIRPLVSLCCLLGGSAGAHAQVVGGHAVPEGKWTDTAAVYIGTEAACTGVLVAPEVVLTAAHCIGGVTKVMVNANNINDNGEIIDVVAQVAYPDAYNTVDIGLLKLARPSTVAPRQISSGCARSLYLADGAEVAIVGYGATDEYGSELPTALMEATTTITDATCARPTPSGCHPDTGDGGELVAGGQGVDSCNGDSGGPLYLRTEHGDFLVGITSRATDDATLPCSQGGVYGRPDTILTWIEQQGGTALPAPVCNEAPEPTARSIEVVSGQQGRTQVEANDGDAADSHRFEVVEPPVHGVAQVDADGTVRYTSEVDYLGTDQITIQVTDDGEPELSGRVVIAITVSDGAGCGCRATTAAGGSSPGLWLVCLVIGVTILRRHHM